MNKAPKNKDKFIKNNNNNNNTPNRAPQKEQQRIRAEIGALDKKVSSMQKNGAKVAYKDGHVSVSMSKNKVTGFLESILNPESATKVLPVGVDDQAICQYSAGALSMKLDNGLVASSEFRSVVVMTGNPECPCATSKQGTIDTPMSAGAFVYLTSKTDTQAEDATSICCSLWLGSKEAVSSMSLPDQTLGLHDIVYNNKTVSEHYIYSFQFPALGAFSIDSQYSRGTLVLWDANKAFLSQHNYDNETRAYAVGATACAYISFIQEGPQDLDLRFISAALTVIRQSGMYSLKPLVSASYKSVEESERAHRVVSSATCLTYAPDLQYGGGNIALCLCDTASLKNFTSYEDYIYTRRRSYLNKALTGGYNVFIASTETLKFSNVNRYNSFASDGASLALCLITYTPSNAAVLTGLNMQVKNHVWYEFNSSDRSRNPLIYLDQSAIGRRMLSGLSLLYRPSENLTHKDFNHAVTTAWHWLNGGSDEATALRKGAKALGMKALQSIPALLALL